MVSTPSTRVRTRGRPARLSRERILIATLKLLERVPPSEVTMARVAAALRAAPMSLYTHVRSREDLLDGAAALALEQLTIEIPVDLPWQDQVRTWCRSLRTHFLHYPQVLHVVRHSGRLSLPWLRVRVALVRALRTAGLDGRPLADAVRWVSQTVVGGILLEVVVPRELSVEGNPLAAFAALDRLDDDDRGELERLLPHMTGHDRDTFFAFAVERVVAAVEALVRAG